ncbi:hypothetical protein C8A00DRAFT_12876, partial [Chaetomidium leptoderma]
MNDIPGEDYNESPPSYSRLGSPRPPPPDYNPEFASGRPNEIDVWDYADPPSPVPSQRGDLSVLNDLDPFERRDMEEYLNDPFKPQLEPGKEMIVVSGSDLKWLCCHYKVFPAYWQCMSCPPHDCFNKWDLKAMHESDGNYRPSCSRPNCGASATSQSVLVNAQKERIATLYGENLMASRVEEPFMWCCQCASLQGDGRNQNPDCDHCINFKESNCPECVRCNKFLEATTFANGDMVKWGVLHLHTRALSTREGYEVPSSRILSGFRPLHQDDWDPVKAYWMVSASSLLLG